MILRYTLAHAVRLAAAVLVAVIWVTVAAAPSAPAVTRDIPTMEGPTTRLPVWAPQQSYGHDIGSVRIPAIGMDEVIREGVDQHIIDAGVAHWVGTAAPGQHGNMVLAGHRTTFTSPFRHLDRLDVGDHVYLTNERGLEVIYRVFDTFIVDPTDIWITYDSNEPIVTMFACHPKGSVRERIVVRAEMVTDGWIG